MRKKPLLITGALALVLFLGATSASAQDCNKNGIPDPQDILNGTSADCNKNGIPDECEGEVIHKTFVVNLPIPDGNPGGVTDTQNVVENGQILDLDVGVKINHTFIGQLTIDVEHNATVVRLWNKQCGANSGLDVIFDDEGTPVVCASPTTGNITPFEPLSKFDFQELMGSWSLTVVDDEVGEVGTLVQWELFGTVPRTACCQGIIQKSAPIPDGGIDAREEHEFGQPNHLTGVSEFFFTFDDNSTIAKFCFEITETTDGISFTPGPGIVEIEKIGATDVRILFDRPITADAWTVVGYKGLNAPVSFIDIGFLPGDVNQSRKSTGFDITSLIDCLNAPGSCAVYQEDIDRSGFPTGNDITRLIDVLQGPPQDPRVWLNEELPAEPHP